MKLKTIFSCLLLAMFSMATIAAVSFTDRQEKSEIKKSETIQNPIDLSMTYQLSEKPEQNVSCKKVERISCAGCHSTYHDIGSLSSPRNLYRPLDDISSNTIIKNIPENPTTILANLPEPYIERYEVQKVIYRC